MGNEIMYVIMTAEQGDGAFLEKFISSAYKDGTFQGPVNELLDGSGDDLNPPYDERKNQLASQVREWIRLGPEKYKLYAETADQGDIPVKLEDSISKYADKILTQDQKEHPTTGEILPFYVMKLGVSDIPTGGVAKLYLKK